MVMIEGTLIVFGKKWLLFRADYSALISHLGVMLSYWIDLGFSFLEPSSVAWRFPIAFQIVLALIIVAIIPGLPESPRW